MWLQIDDEPWEQPQEAAPRIDRSNPLARSLQLLVGPGTTPVDASGRFRLTRQSYEKTGAGRGERTQEYTYGGGSNYLGTQVVSGPVLSGAGGFTIAVRGILRSVHSFACLLALSIDVNIANNGSGVFILNAFAGVRLTSSVALAAGDSFELFYYGVNAGTTTLEVNGTENTDAFGWGAVLTLESFGGDSSVYNYAIDAGLSQVAVWDRQLSLKERVAWRQNPWQLYEPLSRRIWAPAAGGAGNATVALVGAATTSAVGTLAATGGAAVALVGATTTATAGIVVGAGGATTALVGAATTASAGTSVATAGAAAALTGAQATAAAATPAATGGASVALTGASATSAAGVVAATAGGNATVALAGATSTATAGTLTSTGGAATTLTGAQATAAAGIVIASVGTNATAAIVGAAATATPGALASTGGAAVTLTGASTVSAAGTLASAGTTPHATVALVGAAAVAAAGTIVVKGGAAALLVGAAATATAGTLSATGAAPVTDVAEFVRLRSLITRSVSRHSPITTSVALTSHIDLEAV